MKWGSTFLLIIGVLLLVAFSPGYDPQPYEFPELRRFPEMPEAEDNPVTVEGVDLGRHLFYDPILSSDSSISCASCHKQEFAFSDAPKAFSTGVPGTPVDRNTPPIYNLAWYPSLFWDGRAASVEDQVFFPVREHDEMNLEWPKAVKRIQRSELYPKKFQAAFGSTSVDSILIAKAIGQFERTLLSYRSKYDRVLAGKAYFTEDEYKGLELMNDQVKGDCLHCHTTDAGVLGTTGKFSNTGMDSIFDPANYKDKGLGGFTGNPQDNGKFKIPSLRNVVVTAPYMHDGRFETLEEVLDFYSEGVIESANIDPLMGASHNGGVQLTEKEKEQIIAFLKTMTDSAFISDPAFSNPFR